MRQIRLVTAISYFLMTVETVLSLAQNAGSRRDFLRHVPAVALATGVSFFPSIDHDESNSESNLKLGFPKAAAYERRDVGDETRSAATAAMNEQAYKTNNRLEQSGFKLDTREEEKAKISEAFTSFSYESATTKKSGYSSRSGYAKKSN